MYKLLLVDDEEIVRHGIRKKLDWVSLGFTVIGEASNGREALELAEKDWPDVILTDIRMPIMDGIELVRIVNEKMPFTKVIILTGHEEFEYAQKSIKLGVLDYILKPISAAELSRVMVKIRSTLDEKANNDQEIQNLKKQLMQSMPVLRDRFLNDLVLIPVSEKEISEKKHFFGVEITGRCFVSFVVEIDDYKIITERYTEEEKQLLKFSVFNTVSEIAAKYMNITVFIARYDYVSGIIGFYEEENKAKSYINTFCQELRGQVEKTMRITVSVGVGNIYEGLSCVRNSFNEARSALEYKFFAGKNSTIFITDVDTCSDVYKDYPTELEKQLLVNIKLGNRNEIKNLTEKLVGYTMKSKSVTWGYSQIIFNQLLTMILKLLQEMNVNISEVFGLNFNPYEAILRYDTIEDLRKWILDFSTKVSEYITLKRNYRLKSITDKAKEYIENNYHNSEIALNSVARHVNLSDCYFSVVFKAETGEAFQDYLIRIRLNKAKEFLRSTDLKTYEIADRVGYSDPHYFGVSFKKYVGVTPTEYRELG